MPWGLIEKTKVTHIAHSLQLTCSLRSCSYVQNHLRCVQIQLSRNTTIVMQESLNVGDCVSTYRYHVCVCVSVTVSLHKPPPWRRLVKSLLGSSRKTQTSAWLSWIETGRHRSYRWRTMLSFAMRTPRVTQWAVLQSTEKLWTCLVSGSHECLPQSWKIVWVHLTLPMGTLPRSIHHHSASSVFQTWCHYNQARTDAKARTIPFLAPSVTPNW